jgi:predicted ribosomally synthesized peptide with SipW-like signal peptide
MNRRISYSILVILLTLAVVTGGVVAWFTYYSDAPTNVFTAGTVNISANETVVIPPEKITNWFPGDVVEKEFTITNTGSSGIYLRTHITGAWGSLNPDMGKHSNTATVTAKYNGVTYSDSDKGHYYVAPVSGEPKSEESDIMGEQVPEEQVPEEQVPEEQVPEEQVPEETISETETIEE